jgi:hypothetical protein
MHRHADVVLTYLALEGVRGISIAHCNSAIRCIHLHREQQDNSSMYEQAHQVFTWMYCPVDIGEAIMGIWLVLHSSNGTGLLVRGFSPKNINI